MQWLGHAVPVGECIDTERLGHAVVRSCSASRGVH